MRWCDRVTHSILSANWVVPVTENIKMRSYSHSTTQFFNKVVFKLFYWFIWDWHLLLYLFVFCLFRTVSDRYSYHRFRNIEYNFVLLEEHHWMYFKNLASLFPETILGKHLARFYLFLLGTETAWRAKKQFRSAETLPRSFPSHKRFISLN